MKKFNVKRALEFIYKQQREIFLLGKIEALLSWDQMTYMPPMGAVERSKQCSLVSKIAHKKILSNALWKYVQILSSEDFFPKISEKDRIIIKRLKKDLEKARKIPTKFVERIARVTTLAYQAWEEARRKNDFKVFSPHLEEILYLKKEYTDYIDLPGHRYNSLIDDYEEGMSTDRLKEEFDYLKSNLKNILDKIASTERYEKQKEIRLNLDVEAQKKICNILLEKIPISKERIRLDTSIHPFTNSIGYDDIRITTSFERSNPLFSFFSTIHEIGHALYEEGLPRGEFEYTVISDSPSFGLHESQSRLWENQIARSKHFWKYFYPILKRFTGDQLKDTDFETLYRQINIVKPSLIRVEADELTYCLHIVLRFEIELDLIDDKISVDDLPEVWNEKMYELLGIKPNNDVEGVLQDMHWSNGSFGYFPTYAIGTIYASQIFKKLSKEIENIYKEIENADFSNIVNWLRKNIHSYGRSLNADEIIKKACGEGLNSKALIDYLKDKYYILYDV